MQASQIARRVEALEAKVLPPPRSPVPDFLGANFVAYLNVAVGPEAADKVYANVLDATTVIPLDKRRLLELSSEELLLVERYLDRVVKDD